MSSTVGLTPGDDLENNVPTVPRRRIVVASMVGTSIEFYDFYIYATAAVLVFPELFFPKGNDTTALLASLATFGLAFVARPVGSMLFGHFGDVVGRKATLVGSLVTMGVATFLIGVLPTYGTIGIAAPILLAVMRLCQGLGLGGEWSGAALLATETAEVKNRARAAMWPQLGAPIGFFSANAVFLIVTEVLNYDSNGTKDHASAFLTWGWRVPFLLSAIMVMIGLYVRLRLTETPVFAKSVERGEVVKSPLIEVFRTSWRALILGTFVMLSTYTLFYLMTTWIASYATGKVDKGFLGYKYTEFLPLQLVGALFFAAGVAVSGRLADRFGRRPTLITISVLIVLYGAIFGLALNPSHVSKSSLLLFIIVGMALTGLMFGPMSAVLPELFKTNVRYTGSGISYNVASILGAAVAPFIAVWLVNKYSVGWVGLYLAVAAALTLISLVIMRETKDRSLYNV